jgi:lipoprotein NlpI
MPALRFTTRRFAVRFADRAHNPDADTKTGQVCEASFYGGELALQRGRKDEARHLLDLAADDCPKTFIEYVSAKAELKAFGANQ